MWNTLTSFFALFSYGLVTAHADGLGTNLQGLKYCVTAKLVNKLFNYLGQK
jgi:hypothetical protein